MSSRRQRVLIEFTKETRDEAGAVVRSKGDKLLVDPMSARSFVKKKKVAKVIAEKGEQTPDLGDDEADEQAPEQGGDAPAPAGGAG